PLSIYSFLLIAYRLLFFFFFTLRPPPTSTLFPYTTLFRSSGAFIDRTFRPSAAAVALDDSAHVGEADAGPFEFARRVQPLEHTEDRKSTRLNSSHVEISYAVFCLKKKKQHQ